MVIIEYNIDPKDRASFLTLLRQIGRARMRDGVYAWNVFENPGVAGQIFETCCVQSLLELKHIRGRVTNADRLVEEQGRQYLKEPHKVLYLVGANNGT